MIHAKSIGEMLQDTGLPAAYSHHKTAVNPPFLVYLGNGQTQFEADSTIYWRQNTYTVEYYFTVKDEAQETSIEEQFLANGWQFDKSDDIYIESEGLFVIYYYLS